MDNGYTLIPDSFLDFPIDVYETNILAVIYGFSQDGESTFKGSLKYLCRKAKCSRRKVMYALDHLVELGYIIQFKNTINGVTFNEYKVSTMCMGGARDARGGGAPDAPNNIDIDNIDNISLNKGKSTKPTIEEIEQYCILKGYDLVNAEVFFNYYESNGWKVGKNKMQNWHSAVAGWQTRAKAEHKTPSPTPSPKGKKSALQANLEIADEMFGTNTAELIYGR